MRCRQSEKNPPEQYSAVYTWFQGQVSLILHYFDINCSQPKLTFEHSGFCMLVVITEWRKSGVLCWYTSSAYIYLHGVSPALVHRNLYNKGSLMPLLLQKSPKFFYLWFLQHMHFTGCSVRLHFGTVKIVLMFVLPVCFQYQCLDMVKHVLKFDAWNTQWLSGMSSH